MPGSVDVTAALREFEGTLAGDADPQRCWDILAMLWRWQRDPDLTVESRGQAEDLVRRFGKKYGRRPAREGGPVAAARSEGRED